MTVLNQGEEGASKRREELRDNTRRDESTVQGKASRRTVDLDRSLGGELARILQEASARAAASLMVAKQALAIGLAGPAYVWAVRSIEILMKEFMLLPMFLEELNGDWMRAWKRARKLFGSSNWKKAMQTIQKAYGPLEPMLTEQNEDVWSVWENTVVRRRGEIVHGSDCLLGEAALVVQWADQMAVQLKLRLIVARKHPMHDVFMVIMEEGRKAFEREQTEGKENRTTEDRPT